MNPISNPKTTETIRSDKDREIRKPFLPKILMSLSKFEREKALHLVNKMINWPICGPYVEVLDPNNPDNKPYYQTIKEPIALMDIKRKLEENSYSDIVSFGNDVNKIWSNAILFNGSGSAYTYEAKEASAWFNRKLKVFPSTIEEEWLLKFQKIVRRLAHAYSKPPVELLSTDTAISAEPESF